MPNYKEMYLHLFRSVTKAIELLQEAQVQTEDMFIYMDGGEDEPPKRDGVENVLSRVIDDYAE